MKNLPINVHVTHFLNFGTLYVFITVKDGNSEFGTQHALGQGRGHVT